MPVEMLKLSNGDAVEAASAVLRGIGLFKPIAWDGGVVKERTTSRVKQQQGIPSKSELQSNW